LFEGHDHKAVTDDITRYT